MLVANSFDLWHKDAFFSAAEEVQQSADIMESAYRTWLRAKKEGLIPQHLDELGRELQMALGTAKWQLEEFERAVCSSHQKSGDEITITRHRHFVSAIADQIYHVETALRESLNVEGKKPFRWVDLDEEECDDLADFLSGTPRNSQRIKDEKLKHGAVVTVSINRCNTEEVCHLGSQSSSEMQIPIHYRSSEELPMSTEAVKCLLKLKGGEITETKEEIRHQADQVTSNLRAWISVDRSPLEIVIHDNNDALKNVLTEAIPKDKGSKLYFWSSRVKNYHGTMGMQSCTQMKMINWINQCLRGGHRNRRQLQVSPMLLINLRRYIRAFMLITFLAVPFLLYWS